MSKEPPSTAELETGILLTRAHVAADVRALKNELSPEHLKERALDVAERSVESLALRAKRRLADLPQTLLRAGRAHPWAAGLVGLSVVLAVWRTARHR
jgi:hypothetical protein